MNDDIIIFFLLFDLLSLVWTSFLLCYFNMLLFGPISVCMNIPGWKQRASSVRMLFVYRFVERACSYG